MESQLASSLKLIAHGQAGHHGGGGGGRAGEHQPGGDLPRLGPQLLPRA